MDISKLVFLWLIKDFISHYTLIDVPSKPKVYTTKLVTKIKYHTIEREKLIRSSKYVSLNLMTLYGTRGSSNAIVVCRIILIEK